MKGTQCRAMAHTEYRRSREPFAHQSIKPCFGGLVNRRGRLVEKSQSGFWTSSSSEGDALLLAGESWSAPMIRSFRWLWVREPTAKIGYSIFVYDLTNDPERLIKLEEIYVKAGITLCPCPLVAGSALTLQSNRFLLEGSLQVQNAR